MLERLIDVLSDRCDYPLQPRSQLDADYCRSLGEDMKANGQKVPVIGYSVGDRFLLCDGGCRLEGARLLGIPHLLALDLCKEPSRAELLLAQASIDSHRQSLPPIDRARLFEATRLEHQWSARQLSQKLHVTETFVSRTLSLLTLHDELQRQVNSGELDVSKGYAISLEPDPTKQLELAKLAPDLSRDALAAKVRATRNGSERTEPAVRTARVRLLLGAGVQITVSRGEEMDLDQLIEALAAALKVARKGREESLSIKSLVSSLKDKARKSQGHV